MTAFIKRSVMSINEKLIHSTERSAAPAGEIIGEWTMLRIPYSFDVALTCANRGALFECVAISRMILEQIAWASRVHDILDEDEVAKQSASAAITSLRGIHKGAGALYGWLSSHAHWTHNAHVKTFDLSSERIGMMFSNSEFKIKSFSALLVLAQIVESVHLYMFGRIDFVSNYQKVDFASWHTRLCSALPGDIDLVRLSAMTVPLEAPGPPFP